MFQKHIEKKYDFLRNEVTNKILFKEKNENEYRLFDEISFNTTIIQLEKKGYKISPNKLSTFLYSNYVESFDPFKKYFESLPKWDRKTDYINLLAKTIKTTNDEYFQWIFKKWIVALVGCSFNEDITNQNVIIFSGEQGVGKTTWVRKLMPENFKPYLFEGAIIPTDKDTKFYLADKLLINMDELVSFGKSQNEFYKGLITLDYIEQRRPYSREAMRLMRRASFIAGTNNTEILTDLTGNRRYLCVETIKIDKNHSIEMDKVYSQAYYLLMNNFKFYFDADDIKKVNEENKKYLKTPEEYDIIEELFELPQEDSNYILMNASEILDYIKENKRPHKNISVEQIGKTLISLGFKKVTRQKKYKITLKHKPLKIAC